MNLTPSITFLLEKERLKYSEHTALLKFVDRDLGVVESSRRKVCILGAGSSFYPLKPYEEEAWELWCCNGLWRYGFDPLGSWRADRWFEMHPYEAQSEVDLLRLKRAPIMVYGLRPTDISWIPTLVTYPLRRILALPYYSSFQSTFAYQIALAIESGFTHIRLAGIYMCEGREALVERANLLYWIGIAQGLGIDVDLFDCHPFLVQYSYNYGYKYKEEKGKVEEYCRDILPSIARDGWRGSR